MSDDNGNGGAEIKTPVGSLSFNGKKTAEFIAVLSLVSLVLIGYVLFEHKEDTHRKDEALLSTLREMVSAQREQNCLIAMPQNEREARSELCKRLSR